MSMDEPEKSMAEVQKEAEEYLNGWKRAKADLVNYQKQVERERAEWAMFSSASCVRTMLPVLDSLEMATLQHLRHFEEPRDEESHTMKQGMGFLRQAQDRLFAAAQDDIGVAHGIVKIRDQMLDVLRQMGVEAIKTVGEPVNTEFHEVVGVEKAMSGGPSSEASEDGPPRIAPDLIVKEAQRGYTMHGKVLRVAKVIVSE